MPGSHLVGDLRDPRAGVADEQLQQDLEADRVHPVQVDGRPAEREQAAHRIRDGGQATGKEALRQPGRPRRGDLAGGTGEPLVGALPGVAGADHHVHVVPHCDGRQAAGRLRRMLEVRVHHQDPLAAGVPRAEHHRAAQPAGAPAGRPVQHTYGDRGVGRVPGEDLHRVVVAVIHDDNLRAQRREGRAQSGQQRGNVLRLVAGRHDDAQADLTVRCGPVQIGRFEVRVASVLASPGFAARIPGLFVVPVNRTCLCNLGHSTLHQLRFRAVTSRRISGSGTAKEACRTGNVPRGRTGSASGRWEMTGWPRVRQRLRKVNTTCLTLNES